MRPADLRWAWGPDEVDCRGLRGGERPGESWGRAPKVVPCRGGAGGPPPPVVEEDAGPWSERPERARSRRHGAYNGGAEPLRWRDLGLGLGRVPPN
ncbi:hypothetical protein NDU88_000963 [Pleurodeles waltl]|uniref:Uncharacterized protein n=1 Tax=Pleurodeles waltl TaxID=8319 RepID=A0AAV7WKI8_PLEWA|nr:hypothetical protein NDU88_000963 [Pleurodeles waltl]